MEGNELNVTMRKTTGKGAARKLRQQGLVPAICYGRKSDPLPLTVDPHTLRKVLDPERRTNTVLKLHVQGEGAPSQPVFAMIRDYQQDSLRSDLVHVDFVQVSENEPVEVEVPLVFTGRAIGVQMGGQINQVFRTVPVRCLPQNIPSKIEHDISEVDLNQLLRASDIVTGEGVTLLLEPQRTVLSCTMGRAEAEEAKPAEEGEEAAAAEGAAPAAEGAVADKDKDKDKGKGKEKDSK